VKPENPRRGGSSFSLLRRTPVAGLVLALCALPAPASARPETIRAGVSYYSDELIESGPFRDIGTELNYEEVFKRYAYYEVVYDEAERVVKCIEYKRGDVVRRDIYRYETGDQPGEHIIEVPGKPSITETIVEVGE